MSPRGARGGGQSARSTAVLIRDSALEVTLARLIPPGVLIGHRFIAADDEKALLPAEAVSFERSVPKVRRRSGAARIVARELLGKFGLRDFALVRSATGGLVWPLGLIGSVSHDEDVAVAAIAKTIEFTALGVDIEPARALPDELIPLVATPIERQRYSDELVSNRVLFVAKEAVFKALYPTDGIFLDFHDIEVDLDANRARVKGGRTIAIMVATNPRIVAVAVGLLHGD